MFRAFIAFVAMTIAAPALAEGFQAVQDKRTFVSLVNGKSLKRTGISLSVSPDGKISGRALGRPVSGAWQWQGGFFCRDLYWGKRDLGPNCQRVEVQGSTLRFTSDRGQGIYADLTLD